MTKHEELYIAQRAFKEVLRDYEHSKRMVSAMASYILENANSYDLIDSIGPTNDKLLRKRYGIHIYGTGTALAWYLLEKYFEGKVTIAPE